MLTARAVSAQLGVSAREVLRKWLISLAERVGFEPTSRHNREPDFEPPARAARDGLHRARTARPTRWRPVSALSLAKSCPQNLGALDWRAIVYLSGTGAVLLGAVVALQPDPPRACPMIQLFGDSTQRAASGLWQEQWSGRVVDRSSPGSSSAELLAGTDGRNPAWPRSVDADYVVVNHGLNMVPLDQYRADLHKLAAAPGARVIFETPNPSTKPGRDMGPYARIMREVAAEHGLQVIDVFACFQEQPDWQQRLPDGTHPDLAGLRHIVRACAAPVVERLQCPAKASSWWS